MPTSVRLPTKHVPIGLVDQRSGFRETVTSTSVLVNQRSYFLWYAIRRKWHESRERSDLAPRIGAQPLVSVSRKRGSIGAAILTKRQAEFDTAYPCYKLAWIGLR